MRKLLVMLTLLYTGITSAQMFSDFNPEISIGYIVPTQDALGYGKGYLSIGQMVGASIVIGGDSRITYGENNQTGRGWIGVNAWYDILSDRRDWSIKPYFGVEVQEGFERLDLTEGLNIRDPYNGRSPALQKRTEEAYLVGGLQLGWKFIELTVTSQLEFGIGFKLKFISLAISRIDCLGRLTP